MNYYMIVIEYFAAYVCCFEVHFNNFLESVISLTSTLFLMFSIVLPKTLLFMSLKKSFKMNLQLEFFFVY